MAEEAKARGNAAFSSGQFDAAVRFFSQAIHLSPSNHLLYSNRSAAYASLHRYSDALNDAQKTVELNPDWPKGYSRLGAAHVGLGSLADAIAAFRKGLELDPSNAALKSALADAQAAAARSRGTSPLSPFADMFRGPEVWAKLTADSMTRGYLQQPDFLQMMQDVQRNPSSLDLYLKDPRMMQVIGVLLMRTGGTPDEAAPPVPRPEPEVNKEKEKEAEAEAMDVPDEEKDARERKVEAQREKEAGNAAYKKKDFEGAIGHYTKAMELDDEDISFLTNRAAVYMEMGKYEDCIKDCDKAVERGRELRSDFKMIARALTRKGTALVKLAKCSKDYEPAIETFQKALTEHRNPETLKKQNDAEKAKKDLEQQEYFDPQIADEEREKGNECFKQQKYPEAVKHYTEALRRNPQDPRVYSNRAACYTKLGALPEGLKDAEKCIELDATFSKGYTRKGAIQFLKKEYDKALETYQEGLKHDPNNQESLDGVRRCIEQINKTNRGEISPDELKERQAKAMQDPEIQNILSDPVMSQVLMDIQENPRAAQNHLKNPQEEVWIEPPSLKVLERMSSSNSRITKWAPKCPCGSGEMKLFTSHTETNPNRKFWRCPNWNDDGCDAFFWKDEVSREHPPSESNSTPERDSGDLARMIKGIKEALEAQNQIICASIENENLRTMYLYKMHHLFVAICCVLVAMCCILLYMVFRV